MTYPLHDRTLWISHLEAAQWKKIVHYIQYLEILLRPANIIGSHFDIDSIDQVQRNIISDCEMWYVPWAGAEATYSSYLQ
jgi:hypothetical protein